MPPKVIIDPSFRSVDEVFDPHDLDRLRAKADVVWCADEPMPTQRFQAEIPDASAVVFGNWRHGPDALQLAGPQFLALLEVAGGHEHVDIDYQRLLDAGIHVGSSAPAFSRVVAEHGLALTLALSRGVVTADRRMREGTEAWLHDGNRRNRTLLGATVGFVGCGGISRHLQSLLSPFEPTIVGYDPYVPADELHARGITITPLEVLFDEADVIYVLAAPTPATAGLISRALLQRLREHQFIVVLSRASVVDFDALVESSQETGFGFATDVYPTEPLPTADPVRGCEHSVLTPHVAGAFPDTLRSIGRMVVDDLLDLFAGERPARMQYLTPTNGPGLVTRPTGGWTPASEASQ